MPSSLRPTVRQRHNRAAKVLSGLRGEIVSGKLACGSPLRQDELATAYGTSKIPVREALLHLVAEGLVSLEPNRGFKVAKMDAQEATELLDIRAVLECHAILQAIPHIDNGVINAASQILQEAESTTDIDRWSELNWQFHATLYEPGQRPRLAALIQQVSNSTDSYIRTLLHHTDYRGQAQREHRAILAVCDVGNAEAATALLNQHIRQTGTLLKSLQNGATGLNQAETEWRSRKGQTL